MPDNYTRLAAHNLRTLFDAPPDELAAALPAVRRQDAFEFAAFGAACRLSPAGIRLEGREPAGPVAVLISLYALHATTVPLRLEPLRAYKDFAGSMPYAAAFGAHTEQPLLPIVERLKDARGRLAAAFQTCAAPAGVGGDWAFVLYPLPKVALCYICYRADEDFPASVTCLFSSNADTFLPLDALADVGEYTSRAIASQVA